MNNELEKLNNERIQEDKYLFKFSHSLKLFKVIPSNKLFNMCSLNSVPLHPKISSYKNLIFKLYLAILFLILAHADKYIFLKLSSFLSLISFFTHFLCILFFR